jgi:hypothetical protein
MPGGLQDIALQPGVNAQLTLVQNTAGVSVSQLIRYKQNLVQKIGGWKTFFSQPLSANPIRDIIAFESYNGTPFIGFGGPLKLGMLSGAGLSSASLIDITPQFTISSVAPNFSVTSGSANIQVVDAGSSMGPSGAVRFDTPVAILTSTGGSSAAVLVLSGIYPIATIIDANTYTITASAPSPITVNNGGILPAFYVSSGTATIDVLLTNHNYISQFGLEYPFRAPTTVAGQVIQGNYQIKNVVDSSHFQLQAPFASSGGISSGSAVAMNGGLTSIYHYDVLGPAQVVGGAYGIGLYGANLFGVGSVATQSGGAPVNGNDWTLDQWGDGYLIACLKDDAIYYWAPALATTNAAVMTNAPPFNRGIIVAIPFEILMAYGSCQVTGVQDLLQIRWSDTGAQQGFNSWTAGVASFAGGFRLANGSEIRCALHSPLYQVFWTDVDCWTASFVNQPVVFSFQPVGYGCGALGPHCAGYFAGVVYWAGLNNFFMLGGGAVQVLPCTVWDFFFQQLDTVNQRKVRCGINSIFNEIIWFFPVLGLPASGTSANENSAYVKVHIGENQEFEWDYGYLPRTAWADVSGVSYPIGTDNNQFLMVHDLPNVADAAGTAMNSAIETGYFEIGDGTNLSIIDWVLPDAKWSTLTGSAGTLLFTFFTADYPGQGERTYGPYSVTQGIPYINTRMRGRYFRVRIESQDVGSFWRVGRIKFRWAPAGRR